MGRIISFSARQGSGKSELAEICQKAGYEKLYFALPLKQLVSNLIRVKFEEIDELKYIEKEYKFNKMDFMFIANETGIPYEHIRDKMEGMVFHNVRELFQYIGTNVIRSYDENWHVNRIREMIDKDKNYVIDDTRFNNELNMIKELGGDAWFVIRPDISRVSNHPSESTLRWQDFCDKIIVNDGSVNMFKFKWETFLSHYDESKNARLKFLKSDCAKNWKKVYADLDELLSAIDLLEISTHWFTYEHRDFNCETIENIEQTYSNKVIVHYKDGGAEIVANPFNIEDLKFCIKNNG